MTVKGALDNVVQAIIEANGNYNVDVSSLTAPYRLRAQGTVGGKTYKLHSYAEEADVGGNVNITPFTDLIVANVAGQIAETYFDSTTPTDLDSAEVDAQEDALQAKLQDVFDVLGLGTAIDLLNDSFSADHSGLDAALDIIQIGTTAGNSVTITNLVDQTTIQDDITDTTDTDAFVVDPADEGDYTEAVSDNVAIAALFDTFAAEFAGGVPSNTTVLESLLSDDFLQHDQNKGLFVTDISTDPSVIDIGFTGVSISALDSTAGTALVTFNVVFNNEVDPEIETWFVAKNNVNWQLQGNQRIVDINELNFHCNDNDAEDQDTAGACGINVSFWDEDFTNNNTGGLEIASGTFSLIDGTDGVTVKELVLLGTPSYVSAGEVQIYNASTDIGTPGNFSGDWREFGTGLNQVNPTSFTVGDTLQYNIYTDDLNITDPSMPSVSTGAEVATYTSSLLFAPSTTPLYPTATAATITALDNFSMGNNLTIAWTLASGTVSDEVLVQISDSQGNRIEVWDESFSGTTLSTTVASTELDSAAATAAGLDGQATSYELRVRIYAADATTGQAHSVDYVRTIDGPTAGSGGGTGSNLTCGYESGWNDQLDEPLTFNSYTDFEAVIADCGGALAITDNDIIGTWSDTWTENNIVYVETVVFNANGTGSFTETEDGNVIETVQIDNWSVANNLLTLTATVGNISFMDVWALTDSQNSTFTVYSEGSNWSSNPNLATLDGTAEGEIWWSTMVKQ